MKAIILMLLFLFVPPCFAETLTGHAVSVDSGDTIKFASDDGRLLTLRLKGIDAPEMNQPGGADARSYLESLIQGEDLNVETFKTEPDGRQIADIYTISLLVNQQMVTVGEAWWYRKYAPANGTLSAAEVEARTQRRGIWRDSPPVAPWDWRSLPANKTASKPLSTG